MSNIEGRRSRSLFTYHSAFVDRCSVFPDVGENIEQGTPNVEGRRLEKTFSLHFIIHHSAFVDRCSVFQDEERISNKEHRMSNDQVWKITPNIYYKGESVMSVVVLWS